MRSQTVQCTTEVPCSSGYEVLAAQQLGNSMVTLYLTSTNRSYMLLRYQHAIVSTDCCYMEYTCMSALIVQCVM